MATEVAFFRANAAYLARNLRIAASWATAEINSACAAAASTSDLLLRNSGVCEHRHDVGLHFEIAIHEDTRFAAWAFSIRAAP